MSQIGYKKKENAQDRSDPEIEKMPKEQNDIRFQIEKRKDPAKIKEFKKC